MENLEFKIKTFIKIFPADFNDIWTKLKNYMELGSFNANFFKIQTSMLKFPASHLEGKYSAIIIKLTDMHVNTPLS